MLKNVIPDSSKFISLNIPPEEYINYIVNVEKKIRKLFHNLYHNNKISKGYLFKICHVGSRPGILYDNPKVHKPFVHNMPKFRPILSSIKNPKYNLPKLLMPILEALTHNEFTVKDSFSFPKEITEYDSSIFIASPDVESLFTNIILKETINNCVSDLHNKNRCNGKVNKSDRSKLLEIATSEFFFTFDFLF